MVDLFGDTNPVIYLWHVLGIVATCVLIYVSRFEPSIMWIYFVFLFCNIAGIFGYLFGWFEQLTYASSDWDQSEDSPQEVTKYVGVALGVLVVISAVVSVWIQEGYTLLWVPRELVPLSLGSSVFLTLFIGLLGTWGAVVPGEEGMKVALSATFKGYEFLNLDVPFFLHPARLFAGAGWGMLHIILGQNAWPFFLSCFFGGMLWDFCSARCGTLLVGYVTHGIFNTIILVVTFILSLGITVLW